MRLGFEWDAAKATANRERHGVDFTEALTVFVDPWARLSDDPDHLADEHREIIVGHSDENRLLVVSFMERAGNLRIISARRATRRERERYEPESGVDRGHVWSDLAV
ncbi:MAG: BrnT family toxin [Candidatus Binatia bacterium]